MLLAVVDKGDSCFEILSATLVSKLSDVSTSFASLASVPRLDHLGALAKGAETALARNQG